MTNFSTYLNRWPLGQIIYLVFYIKKYKIKSSLLAWKKKKKKLMECYPIIISIMGKIIKGA